MENSIYKTSYKVRIADADKNGILKCNSMLQMLQEAATEHASILGVDFKNLQPLNLGWAISKFIIDIRSLPKWGDRVNVETWASDKERICTYREFSMTDSDGAEILTARSQWVLFDVTERRIARMDRLKDWARTEGKFASSSVFEPLAKPVSQTSNAICQARNDDIDLNGHVNNAIYVIWATESLPNGFERIPSQIRINFLEEVMPHTKVVSACQVEGDTTLHSMINQQTSHECARINIKWRD